MLEAFRSQQLLCSNCLRLAVMWAGKLDMAGKAGLGCKALPGQARQGCYHEHHNVGWGVMLRMRQVQREIA